MQEDLSELHRKLIARAYQLFGSVYSNKKAQKNPFLEYLFEQGTDIFIRKELNFPLTTLELKIANLFVEQLQKAHDKHCRITNCFFNPPDDNSLKQIMPRSVKQLYSRENLFTLYNQIPSEASGNRSGEVASGFISKHAVCQN